MRGYPGLCIALRGEVLYGLRRASPEKEQTTWKDKRNYNNGYHDFAVDDGVPHADDRLCRLCGFGSRRRWADQPACLSVRRLPPHYTYATNKFSAACGTTFATASFFKSGAMNVKVGVLAAIGSFAGSALGAHIVLLLSDEMLRTMMFIILPVAAVIILWQRNLPDENRDDGTLNLKKILLALAIGLGIGLYDGVMGPGTGTFAIIAFTTLMGFDLRTANGNGKVLNLASNYASLFTYLMNGLVVFHIGIPCAISNILGNLLGSHFALKKGARFIRPMMLVVLVLLLGKLISDAVL